jgi:hypothetical protein
MSDTKTQSKSKKSKSYAEWEAVAATIDNNDEITTTKAAIVDIDDSDGYLAADRRQQEILDDIDQQSDPRSELDNLTYKERQEVNDMVHSQFKIPGHNEPVDYKACAQCKAPGTDKKTRPCPYCQRVYYCIGTNCMHLHTNVHADACEGASEGRDEKIADDFWNAWLSEKGRDRFNCMCDFARFYMPNRKSASRRAAPGAGKSSDQKKASVGDLRDLVMVVDTSRGDKAKVCFFLTCVHLRQFVCFFLGKQAAGNAAEAEAFDMKWFSIDSVFRMLTKDAKLQEDFRNRDREREFYAILDRGQMKVLKKFKVPKDHQSVLCPEFNSDKVSASIQQDYCDYMSRTFKEQKALKRQFKEQVDAAAAASKA